VVLFFFRAGPSEVLSILLMAAKAKIKVCPHAGGVGLCEYVRHLAMIDFVCFNPKDEVDRICESTTECSQYFYDEVDFNKTDAGLFYKAPVLTGYARMKPESVSGFSFPGGKNWAV
jgi:L-fuconate dehydratase